MLNSVNNLRISPVEFGLNTLHISSESRPASSNSRRTPQLNVDTISRILKSTKRCHRLHLSSGLCKVARDVICYLESYSFVGGLSDKKEVSDAICAPFIHRYGQLYPGPVLENISYGQSTPAAILTQWLSNKSPDTLGSRSNLFSSEVRVCGIAAGPHPSLDHCVVLIMCNNYFDVIF